MKPGVILVNTARGAIVDEEAMIEALEVGQIRHAGLDVFNIEPLPADHPLTKLPNVTLSAHSAFRTPEASENLIAAAWEHCRRIAKGSVVVQGAKRRASASQHSAHGGRRIVCAALRYRASRIAHPTASRNTLRPHPEETAQRPSRRMAAGETGAFMVRDGADDASSP